MDRYVDHLEMAPDSAVFRHSIEHVRNLTGSIYGRGVYELMRYGDEDHPEWDATSEMIGEDTIRLTYVPA